MELTLQETYFANKWLRVFQNLDNLPFKNEILSKCFLNINLIKMTAEFGEEKKPAKINE